MPRLRVLKCPTWCCPCLQTDFEEPLGAKGKSPWVTLNGEDLADSQLVIEWLGPKFGKNMSSHLAPQEKAVAHAFRVMLEEYFLW